MPSVAVDSFTVDVTLKKTRGSYFRNIGLFVENVNVV